MVPAPTNCLCCGGGRLRKLGEDVTDTLEAIPRRWKVIQTVREKFSCRACETTCPSGVRYGRLLEIGRALMASPRLLMIDEVTLGLAPLVIGTLFAALAELRRQGVTLLTVEQNVPLVLEHADRAYVMNGGRIVLQGTAGALRDDPDLPRRFLGE